MARLQILELPEGANDDRPPFILVVDESVPQRVVLGGGNPVRDYWQDIADKIGACGVIVSPETIDIPANDVPLDTNGNPLFMQDVRALDGPRLAAERTDIASDMDRLAKRKRELTDALGMDRTRDWDDIRNAARGLRKERDAQAEAIERVRNLHRPVEHQGITICAECSAWDGHTTDNSPCGYEHCPTLRALNGDTEHSPEE
ncbi:hypothetical protein [Streptomyces acidicola]|uniref:hypothetical protein n=1 Tax=Streptomyces acidicola TaxID=2596892 RepID=UPI001883C4E6|nr:hypothetical protein [Streptomyces acidicola]